MPTDTAPRLPLSELVTVPRTRIPSPSVGSAGYVGVENLLQGMAGRGEPRGDCPDATAIEFRRGDVLIGNIRPYLRKIWLADDDGATNGDVLLLRVSDEWKGRLLPEFLLDCLSTDAFFDHMNRHAKGSKMPRGDREATLRYRVLVPDLDAQRYAVNAIREIEDATKKLVGRLEAEKRARTEQAKWWHEELVGIRHDMPQRP